MSCSQFPGSVAGAFASLNGTGTSGTSGASGAGRQVALNASSGGVGLLSTVMITEPINVVSTTIDTRDMRRTNNLVMFSGIITLPKGSSVTLNFQLRRSLDDGTAVNVGSTYTFVEGAGDLESESFSFQFLDSNVQPGFYTYSVQISANSVISASGASINNAVLSVLAVVTR